MAITRRSGIKSVAVQVSQALTRAGITAVLTGGAAVSVYSANKYQSYDIDFVTAAPMREAAGVDCDPVRQGPAGGFLSLAGRTKSRAGGVGCAVAPDFDERTGALVSG